MTKEIRPAVRCRIVVTSNGWHCMAPGCGVQGATAYPPTPCPFDHERKTPEIVSPSRANATQDDDLIRALIAEVARMNDGAMTSKFLDAVFEIRCRLAELRKARP